MKKIKWKLGYLIEFGEIGRATSLESTAVDSVSHYGITKCGRTQFPDGIKALD